MAEKKNKTIGAVLIVIILIAIFTIVYVNLPEEVTLMKVFNIYGNVITDIKIVSGQTQIPLNLPAGTYIIQIFFKNKMKAEKIIVL